MTSINIKQRKQLLKEMAYYRASASGFNDILRDDSAWKKLVDVLTAEEEFSLVGMECKDKPVQP